MSFPGLLAALVYVDAVTPHPGKSRAGTLSS